jgi:WD40 repeat protein
MSALELTPGVQKWVSPLFKSILAFTMGKLADCQNLPIEYDCPDRTKLILRTELRHLITLAHSQNIKTSKSQKLLSDENIRQALTDCLQDSLQILNYHCEGRKPESKLTLTFTLWMDWDADLEKTLKTFNSLCEKHQQQRQQLKKTKKPQKSQTCGCQYDWGTIPTFSNYSFFGRQKELKQLKNWIVEEQCRLVAIIAVGGMGKTCLSIKFGKGGIGKTALAEKVAQTEEVQNQFDYVLGRRLNNAMPFEELIEGLIKILSKNQEIDFKPNNADVKLARFLYYLKEYRCLIILDNFETLLEEKQGSKQYREGYKQYGQLLELVATSEHKSCLLLTSREKPPINSTTSLDKLVGEAKPARLFELRGLDVLAGKQIFDSVGNFRGTDQDWKEIIEFYEGNPTALDLVAKRIAQDYSSDISEFLKKGKKVFEDIKNLFNEQFEKLSRAEKSIMYWLAVNRDPVSIQELKADVLLPLEKQKIRDFLNHIQKMFRIEEIAHPNEKQFTLAPLFTEYVTDKLIANILSEIINDSELYSLNSHALIKATSKEYIMLEQKRMILQPIKEQLECDFGTARNLETKLKDILSRLRETLRKGYAAGNILNLLLELGSDLTNYDFSELTVWQAYLQEKSLRQINFSQCDLAKSAFREDFGTIRCVALHPNGKLAAAGTTNGEIILWEIEDETRIHTFTGHSDWVWAIAFSSDGKILASGSGDEKVYLWDVHTKQHLHTLTEKGRVRSVAFSHNSKMIASGGEDNKVKLWDVNSGKLIKYFEVHEGWTNTVAFSPDDRLIASGSENTKKLKIWRVSDDKDKDLQTIDYPSGILSICFSPNGNLLAIAGQPNTAQFNEIWLINTSTWECDHKLPGHKGWVGTVTFNHKDNLLATGGEDKTIRLWNSETGELKQALTGHQASIRGLAFPIENSQTLLSGGEDQSVKLWDIISCKCNRSIQGYANPVWSVTFSPNGSLLVSGGEDCLVRLWDISTENKSYRDLRNHQHLVRTLAFNTEGTLLASGSYDGTVLIWDTTSWKIVKTLKEDKNLEDENSGRVISVAFSKDSKKLAASYYYGKKIRLWNIDKWKLIDTISDFTARVRDVVFSPDGSILAISSEESTIKLWDIEERQYLPCLKGHTGPVWSLSFSPDGKILASGSADKTVRLWNWTTGKSIELTGHEARIRSIGISADGKIIVSGSDDNTLKIWSVNISGDIVSAECILTFEGHQSWIWCVSFSSDGDTVASGSDDGTVKLWSIKNNKCVVTLRPDRFYEGMNIKDAVGFTEAQKSMLINMGAVEN